MKNFRSVSCREGRMQPENYNNNNNEGKTGATIFFHPPVFLCYYIEIVLMVMKLKFTQNADNPKYLGLNSLPITIALTQI